MVGFGEFQGYAQLVQVSSSALSFTFLRAICLLSPCISQAR